MIASMDSSFASWFAYSHPISDSSERRRHRHEHYCVSTDSLQKRSWEELDHQATKRAGKTTHEHFLFPPSPLSLYWACRAGRRGEPLVDTFGFGTLGFEGGVDG
jgi:hypothetical protein